MSPGPNALASALALVGDRWSLRVVEALIDGPRRFAELEADIPGIATNVLAQRLKQLEADQLLLAVPYSTRPVRYSYLLTDAGRDLAGAVRVLAQWSADHHGGEVHPPTHELCGTPLGVRWWCPTCEQPGDPGPLDAVWV